ncbi:MAG: polyphosphate kinase 2 [Anaerolineaceae bacterium]|nr:MAG: polyphosphate kinase 2 [Anaerolineaceae bacterium]
MSAKSGKKKEKASTNGTKATENPPKRRQSRRRRLNKTFYEKELKRLHLELVKWQYWIKEKDLRVVLLFEGRDAAGKGGIIKRITEPLQPRGVRVIALGKPSDREKTQWYFQRYIEHLPAAGEIVIFDRSWYNRAGVERVMGFCTNREYWEFLRSAPEFERMLVRSGTILIKYWLSVSDEEQERRFQSRAKDPTRRWKLSPMDLEARDRWVEYSKAKDIMFEYTDIPEARWYQVDAEDKRAARLNTIRHLLDQIKYKDIVPGIIELPPRTPDDHDYKRPEQDAHFTVPDHYGDQMKR